MTQFIHTIFLAACLMFLGVDTALAGIAHAKIAPTTDESSISGEVWLEDTDRGLEIIANIKDAPPGKHGFHIHTNGSCEDAGKAAGGHYNPAGHAHGYVIDQGVDAAHPGDLGNINVDEDGMGSLLATVPGLSLTEGDYTAAGRAIVIHADEDDFGQPTGNAGARIGCGVIVIKNTRS